MAAQRELLIPYQPLLSGLEFDRFQGNELLIGKTTQEVVLEILSRHPGIQAISCIVYPYGASSELESFPPQPLHWLKMNEAQAGIGRDRLAFLSSLGIREVSADFPTVPAIASLLVIGGKMCHIPQMDFVGRPDGLAAFKTAAPYFLGNGEWAVVDSGASYHAWNLNGLMRMGEWRNFMRRVLRLSQTPVNDGVRPDRRFIDSSLKRGFSALRVHPVLDDPRDDSPPTVVRYLRV